MKQIKRGTVTGTGTGEHKPTFILCVDIMCGYYVWILCVDTMCGYYVWILCVDTIRIPNLSWSPSSSFVTFFTLTSNINNVVIY